MILKGREYTPKGLEPRDENTVDAKNAKGFARRILAHLRIPLMHCDKKLYSSGNYRDPGEVVDLKGIWEERDLSRVGLETPEKKKKKGSTKRRRV